MRAWGRRAVVALLVLHGLLHLLGAAEGLGWADVPQLTQAVQPAAGVAWLVAGLLVLAAAVMMAVRTPWWWAVAGGAAVLSQLVVLTSWQDAWAGTVVNLLLLVLAGYGFVTEGPTGLRSRYRELAAEALSEPPADGVVTEPDLARLPGPVADYVRASGAVGRPRVSRFRATIHGRIRGGPDKPWMAFTGEQVNTYGRRYRRVFTMGATMSGMPVDVLHVYDDGTATMRAKALSLVDVVDSAGPDMDRAETVTVFNDLCVLAPAALVDAPVDWQVRDDHHVVGTFTLGRRSVTAELVLDGDHRLVDFVSDDRLRASPDGSSLTPQRWSTPLGEYREIRGRRLAVVGEGRWHAPEPEGAFTYLEFVVDDIAYDGDERVVADSEQRTAR